MIQNGFLLSVIVPVYNAELYIEKCVRSILKQDYLAMEIILVDDASSDKSGILCDSLAEKNDCIKVLHVEHGGSSKARFAGIQASRGKWITFVDADDWIDENAYKDLIIDDECDVLMTGICRYIDSNCQIMEIPYFKEGVYNKKEILNEILPIMLWNPKQGMWALDPSLCTKIFKKKLVLEQLEKVSEIGSHYGDDSMVIFPMMLQVKRVRILKKIYYYHRRRATNDIAPYIRDQDFIPKLYKVYEYLKSEFKKTMYWDIMKKQLDCFFINALELKKHCYEYPLLGFSVYFPIDKISLGSRVILYGAGKVGKQYWEQNRLYHFCDIVSWVDSRHKECKIDSCMIENPEIIEEKVFDYVLVAVDNYYVAREIVFYLKGLGVDQRKIVWRSARMDYRNFEDVFDIDKSKRI